MNKEKIWDFWAKRYDRLWVQKVSLGPTRKEVLLYLQKTLNKDKSYRILDVGCGIGQTLHDIRKELRDYNIEFYGIDFSKEMIRRAKAINNDISFHQMDVEYINELDCKFDIIICTHSFPYYENQNMIINKFKKQLKVGGYLLLAQASQNNLYDSIAMFFVKFTTGKARYPSVKAIKRMIKGIFICEDIIRIKERFYMPSIYFFALKVESR